MNVGAKAAGAKTPLANGDGRRKVAFLTSTTTFSGGDRHLLELVQRLDPAQAAPWIGCFGADNYSNRLGSGIAGAVPVQTGFRHRQAWRTWWRLRRLRPAVVVFVSGEATSFSWRHYLAARMCTPRVYSIFHNISQVPPPPPGLMGFPRRLLGFGARRRRRAAMVAALSRGSICVSEAVRRPLVTELRFPPAVTRTVRNGVDLTRFSSRIAAAHRLDVRTQLGFGADDVVVVATCRLEPTKGVDILLRALHGLRAKLPQLGAVMVGSGSAGSDLRRLGEDLGLSPRLRWLGFQEDVRPWLGAGDIFVNPSSATCLEAFGLSIAEAMATGLACIASRAGAGPELIRDGEEGLLVPPGEVAALQSALARLALAPAERWRMGELARQRAQREFDLELCMQHIRAILLATEENIPCPKSA